MNKIKINGNLSRKEMINYLMGHREYSIEHYVCERDNPGYLKKCNESYRRSLAKKPIKELQSLYNECYIKHKDDPPQKPLTIAIIAERLKGRPLTPEE